MTSEFVANAGSFTLTPRNPQSDQKINLATAIAVVAVIHTCKITHDKTLMYG
jgi:hypothetical protein